MKTSFAFALILLMQQPLLEARDWYAAPGATANGDGTRQNPWPLQVALTNAAVINPGDTLWLRGGTYNSYSILTWPYALPCTLVGTSNNPIIVRQYPGERAIIDGSVYCFSPCDWITFWGFEITCSSARTNTYDKRPAGLVITGKGTKAINLIVHDTGHPGIMGNGREIYGCIIWGVGIYENESAKFPTNNWTRGSGLYLQNTTGDFLVQDNISSRNFTYGMKAYAENGHAEGFIFDSNIVFGNDNSGLEIDCLWNSITNGTVINNFNYRSKKNAMGYFSTDAQAQHHSLIYSNNYQAIDPGAGTAALWLKRWKNLKVLGNTTITMSQTNEWSAGSGIGTGMGGKFIELLPSTNAVLSYTINSNAYYGGVEQSADWYSWSVIAGTNWYGPFYHTYQPFRYKVNAVSPADGTNGLIGFSAWTNVHGFDRNSTYTTNLPTANVVSLRTNKYERGRAHLVIFNWESNSTANVDVSGVGFINGQRFEVRDTQAYFGTPVLTTNYDAAHPTILIPLTMTNITEVTGGVEGNYTINPNIHTASLFNAFVILPSEETRPTPPAGLSVKPR